MLTTKRQSAALLALVGIVLFAAGCGGGNDDAASSQTDGENKKTPAAVETAGQDDHDHAKSEAGGDHSGWWCPEHGVPEGECARCDSSLVAEFKDKDDWCEEHDRPESQCFLCDPTRSEKFAARYEAKFGKKPPKPEPEDEG